MALPALKGDPPRFILPPYAFFNTQQLASDPPYSPADAAPLPRVLGRGTVDLLAEAIRFYNLGSPWVTKEGFGLIDAHAAKSLPELRRFVHDALFEYLLAFSQPLNLLQVLPADKLASALLESPDHVLSAPKPSKGKASGPTKGLGKSKPEKPKPPEGLFRVRGRVTLRALLLDGWARLQYRPPSGRGSPIGALRLNELTTWQRELRDNANPSNLLAALAASLGADAATPGGTKTMVPGAGVMPWQNDFGLAEKLYVEGARLSTLQPSLDRYSISPANSLNVTAEHILYEVLPLPRGEFPPPFGTCLDGIARLEGAFGQFLTPVGIAVGIPWALVLCSVLRAWLADMVAAIAMVSMPVSRLHDEWMESYADRWDSYLGVALWEALAHRPLEHPQLQGYLGGPSRRVLQPLTTLQDWDIADFGTGWGTGLSPHDEISGWFDVVKDTVLTIPDDEIVLQATNPSRLKNQHPPRRYDVKPLLDLPFTWPYVPLRTEKHTNPDTGLDAYIQAATLHAQLMLFVANALSKLLAPDITTHKPFSGSQLWGGCHYPHTEHRYGRTFDVSLTDPRLLRWLKFSWTPPKSQDPKQKGPKSRKVLIVNPANSLFIFDDEFDPFKKKVISQAFDGVYGLLSAWTKGVPTADDAKQIDRQLAALEPPLSGFPGALTQVEGQVREFTDDVFRRHLIGHVTLLLTNPSKWVFASPLLHLRALRAIAPALLGVPDAAPLWIKPEWYCKPEDHHDHWHIEYPPLEYYALADMHANRKAADQTPELLSVYQALGVEFDAFATFLENWTSKPTGSTGGGAALRERDRLKTLLNASHPPAAAAKALSAVAAMLKPGSDVVKRPSAEPSKELKKMMDSAEHTIGLQRIHGEEDPSDVEIVEGRAK